MLWPLPIGIGVSANASSAKPCGTYDSRGVVANTSRTRGSVTSQVRSCWESICALAASTFDEAEAQRDVCRAKVEQAIADLEARQAAGLLEAEQELSERERDHVDACATLTLMEAGTRPEEIAAQRACVRQLEAEIAELVCRNLRRDNMNSSSQLRQMVFRPRHDQRHGRR